METKLLTAEKVAEILNVKVARVYELSRSIFPASVIVRIGRQVRFDPEELKTWIKNGGKGLAK